MSDEHVDLQRQVVETLRSLQAGGVDWLPKLPPLEIATVAEVPIIAEEPSMKRPSRNAEPAPVAAPSLLDVTAKLTIEERRTALQVLRERVAGCTRCDALATTRKQTVFDDGKIGAELCFIGEAPGADEDAQGKPFVGAAGQLLNKIIAACGMKREEVYICNIIKCRPPGNRTPLPNEAENCREYLDEQLAPGSAQVHRLPRLDGGDISARRQEAARPTSREVSRFERGEGGRHLPSRVPASAPQSGREEGRVGGHEDAASAHGPADSGDEDERILTTKFFVFVCHGHRFAWP